MSNIDSILLPEMVQDSHVHAKEHGFSIFSERALINGHYEDERKQVMKSNMRWLFAPGTNSYLPQLSRYCNHVYHCDKHTDNTQMLLSSSRSTQSQTQSQLKPITNTNCYNLIGDKYSCVKFAEIDDVSQHWLTYYIFYLFCYIKDKFGNVTSNGYSYKININKYNLGQTDDMKTINNAYVNMVPQLSQSLQSLESHEDVIIGYGVSRGSAALVNWMAHNRNNKIKALILEGCPSSVDDLVKYSTGYKHYYYRMIRFLLPMFTSYRADGDQAINNVTKLPKDIPILFITSLNDKTVPASCVANLYNKMKQHGYTNIHYCVLESCDHDDYLSNNTNDRTTYIKAVLSVYEAVNTGKWTKPTCHVY